MIGEFLEEILKLGFVRERGLLVLFSVCFPVFIYCSSSRAGAAAGRTPSRIEPLPWTFPPGRCLGMITHASIRASELDSLCLITYLGCHAFRQLHPQRTIVTTVAGKQLFPLCC